MLYTIGDSHADFTFRRIPGVQAYHLGPWTMNRVGRDGFEKFNVSNLSYPRGERLICCFGEIDVRCHLHKFVSEYEEQLKLSDCSSEIIDPIDKLATNYINTLLCCRPYYNICVMSVPPPCYAKRVVYNRDFPVKGTDEERVTYQRKLNAKLKLLCSQYDLEFLDLDPLYADENGMINLIHSDDGIHVSNRAPLAEKLQQLRWI